MSYEAIVCRLSGVRPHSNADRLSVADAAGIQCIVGREHVDGEIGIVFPEGGTIDDRFCSMHGLYKTQPGGYLDPQGRVRALKLRGEVSFGLWLPIAALIEWAATQPGPATPLTEGATIGAPLCEKYLTPATRRALAANAAAPKKARAEQALPRHYDTPQFRHLHTLPLCDLAIITEKVHGTSGRTGLVEVEQPRPWWLRLFRMRPTKRLEYVSGTRNCILDTGAPGEKGEVYRRLVHERIVADADLQPGEVWFYEIAGSTHTGTPIMATHSVGDLGDPKLAKQLRAQYGERITYDYGCAPDEHRVFVYRITQDGRELPFEQVRERAHAAGFETPVVLAWIHDPEDIATVRTLAMTFADEPSFYSDAHPREGVCVRFEDSASGIVGRAWKHKGFVFCALEGIARGDANYIDAEDAA